MTIGTPVVAYRGPDAASLAERWNGPDRPFVLRPWETVGSSGSDDSGSVDCVVLEVEADRDGRHVAASNAMLDMIGPPYIENPEGKRHHHPADVLGKTDFDLYDPALAAESADDDQSVIETGDPEHFAAIERPRLQVSTDATIYVDPGRARQLFEQLFENAIEHGRDSDDGGARFEFHGVRHFDA